MIGLFCVCPKDTLTSLQPRLGKLLSDLSSQSEVGCAERPHSKYILLHCCTTSSRNKGHVIDVSQLQVSKMYSHTPMHTFVLCLFYE